MSGMMELEWEDAFIPRRPNPELSKEYRKAYGNSLPGLDYFTDCDWLARALLTVNLNDGLLVYTDLDFSELIWLVVSQENSCRFCYAAHRSFLQLLGYGDERIRRLEESVFSVDFSDEEKLALDFARKLSRATPPLHPQDKAPLLEAGFEDAEVDELAFLTALVLFANRFCTLLALPPYTLENLPERWYMKLSRPVVASLLSRQRRRGVREPLSDEHRSGPYSYLVLGLEGLPVAGAFRTLLNDAFSSEGIPQRTRALIFAVIARGLECPASQDEAARLLEEDGLDRESLEPILAHLGSPELSDAQNVILPFARETIHIQASDIQRKAKALEEQIGRRLFLEVVALTSLANMVCRLASVAKSG